MDKIIYICDCKKPCAKYGACQVDCFYTKDEFHTKNGIVRDVLELYSDRFDRIVVCDEVTFYVERRTD